ncbi:Uncharacterised protein [Ewingella americana]|uniref:Uncharacterized protein n=1 Tax=Ewingella americana TaxID=41202 RepID=A0A377NFS4_9GAMM|nr:Uncharacterised protein [Ewingella americana]
MVLRLQLEPNLQVWPLCCLPCEDDSALCSPYSHQITLRHQVHRRQPQRGQRNGQNEQNKQTDRFHEPECKLSDGNLHLLKINKT